MANQSRMSRTDENNPVKHYLMEYRVLVQRRDALIEELDRLREATTRATTRLTGMRVSGGGSTDASENAILRVVDGEARLTQVIRHIGEALAVRLVFIDQLPDERQKTLLTLRYINGWGWERIGYEMHYERTQIFEIHGQAIQAAQRVLEAQPLCS